jgi:hypothetical protein
MGHLGWKTKSHELYIEKSSSHSSGCCFDQNVMENGLKVCFDDF